MFAGAGLSVPAGLPGFDRLRDDAIGTLADHAISLPPDEWRDVVGRAAADMLAEPFMHALDAAKVPVVEWIRERFGHGRPTLGHHLLADLADDGAAVWTVNFDELIEDASGRTLDVTAWPDDPADGPRLLKPHGTLSGQIIVTAAHVLGGLSDPWIDRLAADVAGRIAVLIGYSARDIDFRPEWTTVLRSAKRVVWFDVQASDLSAQRSLLAELPLGMVEFRQTADPAADLVAWCRTHGIARVEPLLGRAYPTLSDPGAGFDADALTVGRFEQVIGRHDLARRTYRRHWPRAPIEATKARIEMAINQNGRATAFALRHAAPVVRLRSGELAARLERKALTIAANVGDHERVLQETEDYERAPTSVAAVLRVASLRVTGDLDTAVELAQVALARAETERHPIRAAHASFQLLQTLIWAYRLDEARVAAERNGYLARNGANRWVAWHELCLAAIHARTEPDAALGHAELGIARFEAERLLDGVTAGLLTTVVIHRAAGDIDAARTTLGDLVERRDSRAGTYYLRGSELSAQWVELERAELLRIERPGEALERYRLLAGSAYPIMSSLALVGLAACQEHAGDDGTEAATRALELGRSIGARYQVALAERFLQGRLGTQPILFP